MALNGRSPADLWRPPAVTVKGVVGSTLVSLSVRLFPRMQLQSRPALGPVTPPASGQATPWSSTTCHGRMTHVARSTSFLRPTESSIETCDVSRAEPRRSRLPGPRSDLTTNAHLVSPRSVTCSPNSQSLSAVSISAHPCDALPDGLPLPDPRRRPPRRRHPGLHPLRRPPRTDRTLREVLPEGRLAQEGPRRASPSRSSVLLSLSRRVSHQPSADVRSLLVRRSCSWSPPS